MAAMRGFRAMNDAALERGEDAAAAAASRMSESKIGRRSLRDSVQKAKRRERQEEEERRKKKTQEDLLTSFVEAGNEQE